MTEKEAFEIAKRNGYGYEVVQAVLNGFTPKEALNYYDLLPNYDDLTEVEVLELMIDEEVDMTSDQDLFYNI